MTIDRKAAFIWSSGLPPPPLSAGAAGTIPTEFVVRRQPQVAAPGGVDHQGQRPFVFRKSVHVRLSFNRDPTGSAEPTKKPAEAQSLHGGKEKASAGSFEFGSRVSICPMLRWGNHTSVTLCTRRIR